MAFRLTLLALVALTLTGCPEKCTSAECTANGGGSATGGGSAMGGGSASTGGGSASTGGGSSSGGGAATGGGTGGGSEVDAGAPLALADFCAQFPAAACAHLAACGKYELGGSTTCLAQQSIASSCAQSLTGSVRYDGRQAQRCMEELRATPLTCYTDFTACGNLNGIGREVFGTVFTQTAGQCLGASCDGGACDDSCSGPTCQPFKARGQPCEENTRPFARCEASSWCGSTDGGANLCLALGAVGDRCDQQPCARGSFCEYPNGPGSPTCQLLRVDGATCQFGAQCVSEVCRSDSKCGTPIAGASCLSPNDCGTFASTLICVGLVRQSDGGVTPGACGPRPSLGQACDYVWALGTDPCHAERGEGCIDGVCRVLTPFTFPVGTECPVRPYGRVELPFYGFASCEKSLRCLPSTTAHAPRTGRCAAPLAAGAPCRDSFWCTSGLLCSPQGDGGSACTRPSARGESCSEGCRTDSTCTDAGVCGALLPLGADCPGYGTCEVGATCDGTTCVALGAVGGACDYDFQCASNACQAHQCVAMCIR